MENVESLDVHRYRRGLISDRYEPEVPDNQNPVIRGMTVKNAAGENVEVIFDEPVTSVWRAMELATRAANNQ